MVPHCIYRHSAGLHIRLRYSCRDRGVGMGAFAGATGSKEMPVFFIIAMIGFYILLFAIIFGCIGYSIYMGIKSYQGKMVKYPVIGNKVYAKVYGTAS